MTVSEMQQMSKRLACAQWFARKGITVFIVVAGSKSPLGGYSWYTRSTTDPAQVAEWFAATPDCNYGLWMGPLYVVIDLDVKPGVNGIEEFTNICSKHGITDFRLEIPTLQIRTPGGGYHLFFRVPFPVANANRFPAGIDVRGAIGYVVGAGSCDSRGEWEVVDPSMPIMDLPEWLFPFLREPGQRDPNRHTPLVELDLPENIEQANEWLQGCKPAIEGENGDDFTYEICCKLRDFGLSEGAALEALTESGWNSRCEPPWDLAALEKKIENSYQYGQNRPGVASESLQLTRLLAAQVGRPEITDEKVAEMFHPKSQFKSIPQKSKLGRLT